MRFIRRGPFRLILLANSIIAISPPFSQAKDFAWEEIEHNSELTVFKANVEENDIVALKAVADIPSPIGKVVSVLRDAKRQIEWVDRAVDVRVLEIRSPSTRIEYNHTSLPWPLKDRDFVYESKMEIDERRERVAFFAKSASHDGAPECLNCVRATIFESSFILTPLANKTHTRLEVILHADPEGSVPKWLVNWVQRGIPKNTVRRLIEQLKKPDIKTYPLPASFRNSP